MARPLSKTLTITRAAYKTVEVVDGVPQFVDHPDAVFSGILEKERVERMLRGQLGKDAIIVVTSVDSGQHRYEMDLETFVLNARFADEREIPPAVTMLMPVLLPHPGPKMFPPLILIPLPLPLPLPPPLPLRRRTLPTEPPPRTITMTTG